MPEIDGVVLVSGVPGAGKSTIAPRLAARFPRGVCIEADALQKMIVSGARWPGEEPADEGYRQLRLRARNACLLADSFHRHGFVPVIDDIVIGTRLDDFLADLETRPVYLVQLLPGLDVLRERNASRDKDAFHESRQLDAAARATEGGLRLDTGDQTVEQTLDEILARIDLEARVR